MGCAEIDASLQQRNKNVELLKHYDYETLDFYLRSNDHLHGICERTELYASTDGSTLPDRQDGYEINLDYLLTISGTSGYYSIYWDRRNADLRYVLTTSQYRRYCNVPYFYRPIVWDGRNIYLRIYDRYTNRSRFYYPRPATYSTFRGGKNRGASWYNPRVTRSTTNSSTWRNSGPTGTNNRQYKNNNDRFGNNVNSRPATSTRPNSSSRGSVAPSNSGSGSKGQFGGTRR